MDIEWDVNRTNLSKFERGLCQLGRITNLTLASMSRLRNGKIFFSFISIGIGKVPPAKYPKNVMTAISLDNKEVYRASVKKTTESKLTISINNRPEYQSVDGERDWERASQQSNCLPPGPVKPTPLFSPCMSRGGDKEALSGGEPREFWWPSYSLPSRYATTPYWTSSLFTCT